MYLYILFSRRLVDYGNITKANMTAFSVETERGFIEKQILKIFGSG